MNKLEIQTLVRHIEEKANSTFNMEITKLKVLFAKKGTCAGVCRMGIHYNFNLHIAENNHGYEQTVWHEVAHQIAHQLYGPVERGHGKYWKSIMRRLGRKPNRCHNYKVVKATRITKLYHYKCGCGEILPISSVRYNKFMKKGVRYKHNCGRSIDMTKAVKVRRG